MHAAAASLQKLAASGRVLFTRLKLYSYLYFERNNIILVVVLLLLSSTRAKTSSQSSIDTTVHHKLDVPDRPSCINFTAPYTVNGHLDMGSVWIHAKRHVCDSYPGLYG